MTLQTRTVADLGLGLQAWIGPSEPDPRRPWLPARDPTLRPKPIDGFFTSTWDPEHQTCPWLGFLLVCTLAQRQPPVPSARTRC